MAILFKNYNSENENIGLFKKFMENGLVFSDWKKANVTVIFKKSDVAGRVLDSRVTSGNLTVPSQVTKLTLLSYYFVVHNSCVYAITFMLNIFVVWNSGAPCTRGPLDFVYPVYPNVTPLRLSMISV